MVNCLLSLLQPINHREVVVCKESSDAWVKCAEGINLFAELVKFFRRTEKLAFELGIPATLQEVSQLAYFVQVLLVSHILLQLKGLLC